MTSVLPGTYLRLERSGHHTVLNSASGEQLAITRHRWGTGGAWATQATVGRTHYRRQIRRALATEDVAEIERAFGKNYVDWTLRKRQWLTRQGRLAIRCVDWKNAETHDCTLRVIGRNFNGKAKAHMRLYDGRWLRLRVQGMQPNHAIMSAVAPGGETLIGYRFSQGSTWSPRHLSFRQADAMIEVVVSPSLTLCRELFLAIAISALELRGFFIRPRGGT